MPPFSYKSFPFARSLGALALWGLLVSCDKSDDAPSKPAGKSYKAKTQSKTEKEFGFDLTPEQLKKVAELKVAIDPDQKEDKDMATRWRGAFENREFDQLEKEAAELRKTKALSGSGRWRIISFYESLLPSGEELEDQWQAHEQMHKDWVAARPESVTAHLAHAEFLVNYAWKARGSGYANTVTDEGFKLMTKRLGEAHQILVGAHKLKDKDPMLFETAMGVALGEGWEPGVYGDLVNDAHQFEPKCWVYDTSRAYSLLPRWYGEKGDWEAFADKAAARPDGLGAEVYARIVIKLFSFYDNIFRDTKASWPKTREGLQIMLKKYPKSVELQHRAALLATFGNDRKMAKELFDKIGDTYLPSVYRKPEVYEHYRHWADTGNW